MYNTSFLQQKLQDRIDQNTIRTLPNKPYTIDLCSNDYLGIAKNNLIQPTQTLLGNGSTGSRLISGNTALAEITENKIAQFHEAEAALIFNSGYCANIGLIACVAQRHDTIIYDSLCHASIRDGIRLSMAKAYSFAHNNIDQLQQKLNKASGNIFVVTESVFSMDGDVCPLPELVNMCKKYNAHLIIDEAHAIGTIGNNGNGLVQHLQLHQHIFARIITFGKALGCHGAAVLGNTTLKQYLINFAKSFIYTTALSPHSIACIHSAYNIFPLLNNEREKLNSLIHYFKHKKTTFTLLPSNTCIQGVLVQNNLQAKQLEHILLQKGIFAKAILYPTVAKGAERLRIILHSYNTTQEIDTFFETINHYNAI
jgi:8-amino-7-oxononanoate synthase